MSDTTPKHVENIGVIENGNTQQIKIELDDSAIQREAKKYAAFSGDMDNLGDLMKEVATRAAYNALKESEAFNSEKQTEAEIESAIPVDL